MPHTNGSQLEVFTDPQISLNLLIFLKKTCLNSTQAIAKFTSQAISILIILKIENIFFDKSASNNKNLDSFTKKYHEYCTLFGLKQLKYGPTRVTCNSFSCPCST